MKHTKKALAMLLALVMLLALQSVTAFAADTGCDLFRHKYHNRRTHRRSIHHPIF